MKFRYSEPHRAAKVKNCEDRVGVVEGPTSHRFLVVHLEHF